MSLAEVEQARVHMTFPKDSVFLEAQQPAKASVLVKLRPGAHLLRGTCRPSTTWWPARWKGLAPDAVSVLDMNGNLLGRPANPRRRRGGGLRSEALEYRQKVEADLLAKINATLEPLLGADKFRAGVSAGVRFLARRNRARRYSTRRAP